MSFRSDMLQALGDWIVAATGLVATNLQRANEVRTVAVAKPRMTMALTSYDQPIGTDEVMDYDNSGTQQHLVKGWRSGLVTLSGFGHGSEEWLIELAASAKLPGHDHPLACRGPRGSRLRAHYRGWRTGRWTH